MNDTIAATASGLSESGIGIIRISGPESYDIIKKIFVPGKGGAPDFDKPNRIHYGYITTPGDVSRETLDEVLVMNMRSPHTYTGEDTIEIDCHGGVLMMKRILKAVLDAGARTAEPGEFTKRAFLNGRIDLAQSESVLSVIKAGNERAAKAAMDQLKGRLSEAVSGIREMLLHEMAYLESALDDPEHYSLEGAPEQTAKTAREAAERIDKLRNSYSYGKILSEGINTYIIGKPNAGKSSLLNMLLGDERAIVTQIPGTTRDTISEKLELGGFTLVLTDTAGIRNTEDPVEKIGVRKALEGAAEADLVLCVLDMSSGIEEPDREILETVKKNGIRTLYLLNKSDLPHADGTESFAEKHGLCAEDVIEISAKTGRGTGRLLKRIEELFENSEITGNDQIVLTSMRHKQLLDDAAESLSQVLQSVENGMPEDFYTIDLNEAYLKLGLITGEEAGDDLIDRIFSEFCMGK